MSRLVWRSLGGLAEAKIVQAGSLKHGLGTVLGDQKVGGAPDIEVADHVLSVWDGRESLWLRKRRYWVWIA
jgi:hypothetical protein